jgi:hypothetical protein
MAAPRVTDAQVAEAIEREGTLAAAARALNYETKHIRKRALRSPVIQAALNRRLQKAPGRPFRRCACGCGQVLVRRENEAASRFSRRVAASRSCAAKLKTYHPKREESAPGWQPVMTFEAVGKVLGISRSRVQQLEKSALRKLKDWAEGFR